MIEQQHPQLSFSRQCELVSIARCSYYYQPSGESDFNLELMRRIDDQYLKAPWYGSRTIFFAIVGPIAIPLRNGATDANTNSKSIQSIVRRSARDGDWQHRVQRLMDCSVTLSLFLTSPNEVSISSGSRRK